VDQLSKNDLRQGTVRNIETYLTVANAFEADGQLLNAAACLSDIGQQLEQLAAAIGGRARNDSLIDSEDDILPYRDAHNIHVVDTRYITGAQPTAAGYEWLRSKGVTTVITLRLSGDEDRRNAEKAGLKHFAIPWRDEEAPERRHVEQMLQVVDEAPGKVFQHCLRGIGRDLTMAACYRVLIRHESADEVVSEAVQRDPRWTADQADAADGTPAQFAFLRSLSDWPIST
jgi:protein tyrosine phosphatase (PTP) superfamily phosphohydrolase (DUF442 family)